MFYLNCLCKKKPHSIILLDKHVSEIINKLRLYDVVKNLKMERLHEKVNFLLEIMTKVWRDCQMVIKNFRDMCLVDKAKTILKWLEFAKAFIADVLYGRNSIDIDQIKKISSISESFRDDEKTF
ncbi:hypothetical protein TSAR_006724 [Trichomalopsis sarcophagae]|uniref:Uncharacterized protein n=1 Tax=Trichomalopsis sarcophagae TaxID=543379 RepID=A0A232EN95_9HYME|nr:hypothetical protein TSAR_006724 [Trichomalopsis sarcophagae]